MIPVIVSSVLVGIIIVTLIMFPLFLSKDSPYDSSDCIIGSSEYNHRDINNVSSIFLVKSALMIPVIVSSVVVGIIIMTLIMFPLFS